MITAFIDMVGLLMVIPLLPFYAKSLGQGGLTPAETFALTSASVSWRDIERFKERTSWPLYHTNTGGISSQFGVLDGIDPFESDVVAGVDHGGESSRTMSRSAPLDDHVQE